MRACVLALAVTAMAQPALAREHHKSSQAVSHHRYGGQVGYQVPHNVRHHFARSHHRVRFARVAREPVISGYAMPQSFARTDSTDSAWNQTQAAQRWQQAAMPSTSFEPAVTTMPVRMRGRVHDAALDSMIARHAAANGLPVELVRRVVARESGFNPRASNAGNIGLMQIRYATARSMGYTGSPSGLLDAETNLTYAVRYLAGAYRAAGGNHGRAVAYYASGYHGRGVAVARRAAPAMVAEATSFAPSGFAMADGMQSEIVMARRHMRRQRSH